MLGLGRAYAMQGDTGKAKAAYQDSLTLWKVADKNLRPWKVVLLDSILESIFF